ncbi:DUF2252 family protein [Oligoflexus tunisiensis]|uniref:DUF2252 family protein n=1 Tax=Oligoflexus tunisiensis TaxID=708132 RepID=UPI00159F0434|nr:DUF2252 family protein [Oligoflexus tunisiensis]
MNQFQMTLFAWIFLLLIGCVGGPEVDDSLTSESRPLKLPELSQEPLAPAVSMTADYFHQSYPHLTAEEFQQKWRNSHKSGLLFMRSFVNTWYDELGRISNHGPLGPCFGDPHPENFGYLVFAGVFKYTYNDVDDSGACPVLFDALRYFTTLKIMVKDIALEANLRRAYVHFLNDGELKEQPSQALRPDPDATREKILKKSTNKGKIKLVGGNVALAPDKAEALFTLLTAASPCASCRRLDASQLQVQSGGSAGLDRYWLLVETAPQTQELIEFKELTSPASQRGPWTQKQTLSRKDILDNIWGKNWPRFFAFVYFEGKPFLMRSRLSAEVSLDELKPEQRKAMLTEQVYLLAQLHKKTLTGNTLLAEWLARQSEFQARRYGEALLAARGG